MKNKHLVLSSFLLLALAAFILESCKHETDEMDKLPTVSYSSQIEPIIMANCTKSGCHGNGSSEGEFSFTNYNDVMKAISAGNPNSSKLYTAITSKWETMPASPNEPLTTEQRTLIYTWIKQGAKNN